jgi:cell division protein FtsB
MSTIKILPPSKANAKDMSSHHVVIQYNEAIAREQSELKEYEAEISKIKTKIARLTQERKDFIARFSK